MKKQILKNQKVKIIAGDDRGKTGKVLKVFPKTGSLLVEGINLKTRHLRARREGAKGQKVSLPRPIDRSNVQSIS